MKIVAEEDPGRRRAMARDRRRMAENPLAPGVGGDHPLDRDDQFGHEVQMRLRDIDLGLREEMRPADQQFGERNTAPLPIG